MSPEAPWTPTRSDRALALRQPRPGLTYETFYGLRDKPFSLSSDPAFFYSSASHVAALDGLLSGIRRRESLSVLSGDIGMGKTTLCRTVLQNLDRQTFSAFVPDPFATREDLLKVILVDFGIVSAEDLATGRLRGASRTELSYLLYEFLGTLSPLQAFAVVFIDEAQNLSVPLLEEIRILSDSDGRERQLQVVLVGQLELRDKLHLPEMRQVAQRVSVCCGLAPLDRDGVEGYIAHRLHVAGGTPDRVRFAREALDSIFEASRGVPRLINRLCDRALHHGHVKRLPVIDLVTVALARADVEPLLTGSAPERERGERESHGPDEASALVLFGRESDESHETHKPAVTGASVAQIDASVRKAAQHPAVTAAAIQQVPVAPVPPTIHRGRAAVPLTHTERPRASMRRLTIAVLLLAILAGSGFGLRVAVNSLTQPVDPPVVSGEPAPPALPAPMYIPEPPEEVVPALQD